MSVQRREGKWRVRWQEGDRWRSRTFDTKRDAALLDAEVRRRKRLGSLASLDAGSETLDEYVTKTWAPTFAAQLAPKTRRIYAGVYDRHVSSTLGSIALRELSPELIARWQADRLAAGVGPSAVRKAFAVVGSILQRAAEGGRIPTNPTRVVRKGTATPSP